MNHGQAKNFLLAWAKLGRKEYLKDPRQCEVYLKRLQFFLNLTGNPEKQIPHYIHVAGTSGKGSVCLMLDSILRADKRRVGAMTSPEIGPTQTMWQVNGKAMSDAEFAKILTELKPKLDQYLKISPYDPISHFELMTAIGLYWFAKKRVDWAILEAGCGGRYDSTNIIPRKDIAVITNISLDHIDILGKTKEKIAYEKAGIIKKNCLVFTGERDKKLLKIFEKEMSSRGAKRRGDPNGIASAVGLAMTSVNFKYRNKQYKLPCIGEHQVKNAILAIGVAESLKISEAKIKAGLAKVKLPLRMEIVSKKPLVILDGAHNPDKMRTTINTMKQVLKFTSTQVRNLPTCPATAGSRSLRDKLANLSTCQLANLHLLTGFSADKNIAAMIKQLAALKPASVAIAKFSSPFKKAAEPKNIIKYFPGIKTKIFSNSHQAFNWSRKQQKNGDLLLITGSLYLSGEIRQKLTIK